MYIPISPLDTVHSGDWRINVSKLQANPLSQWRQQHVEKHYLRAWNWARAATKAALEFAAQSTDPAYIAECERIAKRHDGVWRAANKLVRTNRDGKQVRACVPVRSDAGDATCPTWLEREGRKRHAAIAPVYEACEQLGYTIGRASISNVAREYAETVRNTLGSDTFRKQHNIQGADVLIVPDTAFTVKITVICVFSNMQALLAMTLHSMVFKPAITHEAPYQEPYFMAMEMGPQAWIMAQLRRFNGSERARDRATYGCLYGKQAKELVLRGASKDLEIVSDNLKVAHATCIERIKSALDIVQRAAEVGDLVAAKTAHTYAVAYAKDAQQLFAAYPLIAAALMAATEFDFTGLDNSIVPVAVTQQLLAETEMLPRPNPNDDDNDWECIELVTIHSPKDIAALAAWMREV